MARNTERDIVPELLNAVMSGSVIKTEELVSQGKDTIQLSSEEGRLLFKEAIMSTNYQIIQALIDGRILENESSPREYLKPLNGRTVFGFAVLDKFDEGAIKILSSSGYDILCKDECAELVSNLTKSYNPDDMSNFTTQLYRLKVVLTMCQKVSVHRTLRSMLYNELRTHDSINSVEWLNSHFKYGYGICKFNVVDKIHMELGEGKWSDAINSILLLDENEVNENFYDSFPPGEDIPRWTLLSYAVSKGQVDIVNMLIYKGADVNKHSERIRDGRLIKFTPFELAVDLNFLECCRLLVKNGAQLYLQSSNSIGNILRNAIHHENLALVKLILQNRRYSDDDIQACNVDIARNVRDMNIKTQMTECLKVYRQFERTELNNAMKAMLLFQNGTQQEALKYIQELSADDFREEICQWRQSWTLLAYATKLNKLAIVGALLERGCDVNQSIIAMPQSNEYNVKGALIVAIEENNCDMCKVLLNKGAQLYYFSNSVFPHAFRQKNQQILKLLVEHLDDPCDVIREYASFVCISVSEDNISDNFTLDFLCFILQKSRISVDLWFYLIRECSLRTLFKNGAKRGRHYFLNLLLNFFPGAPIELQTVLLTFNERTQRIRPASLYNAISFKESEWLRKNMMKCPSLQNICRFAVRLAVQPFTEGSVRSLGLPVQLQDYLLEHPLNKISEHLIRDDLRGIPIDQQGERFYLYVDLETH